MAESADKMTVAEKYALISRNLQVIFLTLYIQLNVMTIYIQPLLLEKCQGTIILKSEFFVLSTTCNSSVATRAQWMRRSP